MENTVSHDPLLQLAVEIARLRIESSRACVLSEVFKRPLLMKATQSMALSEETPPSTRNEHQSAGFDWDELARQERRWANERFRRLAAYERELQSGPPIGARYEQLLPTGLRTTLDGMYIAIDDERRER